MKALQHRNIVNLREVLASKHKLYIVMDLVKGGELFTMIERQGKLDESTARSYFQQLVNGMHHCHTRGVFHRDLKPENLLLDENGVLKITDFGVRTRRLSFPLVHMVLTQLDEEDLPDRPRSVSSDEWITVLGMGRLPFLSLFFRRASHPFSVCCCGGGVR